MAYKAPSIYIATKMWKVLWLFNMFVKNLFSQIVKELFNNPNHFNIFLI
jgi:hypothetical protein